MMKNAPLGLSFLLLAAVGASMGSAPAWAAGAGCRAGVPPQFSAAANVLAPAKADAFKQALRDAGQKGEADCKRAKLLKAELNTVLVAPSFDKAAFISKASEAAAIRAENMNRLINAFATEVAKLSPEERKAVSIAMQTKRKASSTKEQAAPAAVDAAAQAAAAAAPAAVAKKPQ